MLNKIEIPRFMKSVFYEGLNKLTVKQVPIPEINEDEILIKIDCCSLCGSDLRIINSGSKRITCPSVLGHEISGRVVKIGKNHEGKFEIEERICLGADVPCGKCFWCKSGISNNCENTFAIGYEYPGGFSEYLKLSSRIIDFGPLLKISNNSQVLQEEFALTEPLACCINAFELISNVSGKKILIFGAGSMGVLLAKYAIMLGALSVNICDIESERLESAKIANADNYVLSSEEELDKLKKEVTSGEGFDYIIIACPSIEAQRMSFNYIRNRGIINFFGGLPQNTGELSIPSNLIHYKELIIFGSHGSTPVQFRTAAELILKKRIYVRDLISRNYPLERLPEAIEEIKRDKSLLKIMIKNY